MLSINEQSNKICLLGLRRSIDCLNDNFVVVYTEQQSKVVVIGDHNIEYVLQV